MAQNFSVVCLPTSLSLNKSRRLASWHVANLLTYTLQHYNAESFELLSSRLHTTLKMT